MKGSIIWQLRLLFITWAWAYNYKLFKNKLLEIWVGIIQKGKPTECNSITYIGLVIQKHFQIVVWMFENVCVHTNLPLLH